MADRMSNPKSVDVVARVEERRRLAVEWMAESRQRQGLPPTIQDPVVLANLAVLIPHCPVVIVPSWPTLILRTESQHLVRVHWRPSDDGQLQAKEDREQPDPRQRGGPASLPGETGRVIWPAWSSGPPARGRSASALTGGARRA
jgi:hypothetical protein